MPLSSETQSPPEVPRGYILSLGFAFLIALVPPLLLGEYLEAEGPMTVLLLWSAFFVLVFSLRLLWSPGKPQRFFLNILAILSGGGGLALILLQLNVARRSLAEAWLYLVRDGRGFGFFSFFAVEIFALLCAFAAVFAVYRGISAGIVALLSTVAFVHGTLYASGPSLYLSLFLGLAAAVAGTHSEAEAIGGKRQRSGPLWGAARLGASRRGSTRQHSALSRAARRDSAEGEPFQDLAVGPAAFVGNLPPPVRNRLRRWLSVLPPFLAALVFSLPFSYSSTVSDRGAMLRFYDLTPLVLRFFPSLPLLLDVPGYGFGVGASRLAPQAFLSDASLFSAQGKPYQLIYLATGVYQVWTGSGWLEVGEGDEAEPVQVAAPGSPGVPGASGASGDGSPISNPSILRLTLEADLYDRIPLPSGIVRIDLGRDAPPVEQVDRYGGLRFSSSATRGFQAELAYRGDAERKGDPSLFLEPGPDPEKRLQGLADFLMGYVAVPAGTAAGPAAASPDDGGEPIAATADSRADIILEYLRTGFRYSLRTTGAEEGTALERFLLDDKTGYCLHFAGAFVVLARRMGVPARVVEGFRLSLDSQGRGLLRGVDSHAWAEYWTGSAWLTVEPTPPFDSEDPYDYWDLGDRASFRQLSAIFGPPRTAVGAVRLPGQADQSQPVSPFVLYFGLAFAALILGVVGYRLIALGNPVNRIRRRAAALVRRGRRNGVDGPERIGWTAWAQAMAEPIAEDIARTMLSITFDRGE